MLFFAVLVNCENLRRIHIFITITPAEAKIVWWEPFGIYPLNNKANLVHFQPNWASLAMLNIADKSLG